jgi:hypothetical protein
MLNTEKVKAAIKEVKRETLYKPALANLKTLLPAKNFIVTGSYVLAIYGLVDVDDVHDLDIILVNPEQTALDNITNYVRDFPAKNQPPKDSSFCQGIFYFGAIKVDVFVENDFAEPVLNIDGVNHTLVPHIIKAKKSYNRIKDWLQCRAMSRIFFKQEEFAQQLNDNWKALLREDY